MAVMVVPMLAPRVKGKICISDRIPAPASGTAREVVIELLWTAMVSQNPQDQGSGRRLEQHLVEETFDPADDEGLQNHHQVAQRKEEETHRDEQHEGSRLRGPSTDDLHGRLHDGLDRIDQLQPARAP